MKFSRNFLIGFILLLCVSIYGIINLAGCGALVALVSSIFGSQGGFVFIPFLSEDKLISEQSGTSTGMVVLYSNNPPSGYHGAEGATVTIGGVKGTTDGKGYFNLSGLPVGLNTLTVEYGSFVPIEQPVVVADPNGSSVSFSGFKVIPERLLCPVGIGGTYQFSVYAADSNGNPVTPSATWSVEGDIGTVSSTGIFTATKSGIGKVVAVNGSNRSEVSITVTDGSGTVKGAVTYNGNGLSGVKVKAENFTNYAVTDGSGNYVLPGIPSNPVTVIATAADGKTGTGYGSVPAGGEVEVNIVLTGNPVTPTPVLTPGDIPRGDIGGKIVEYDGNTPIGGAFVVFYSYSYPSGSSMEGSSVPLKTATADSGGNFLFSGVPQGACRVEFWRSESEYNGSPGSPFGAVNDEVTAGGKSINVRPLVEPTATPTVIPSWKVSTTASLSSSPLIELLGIDFVDNESGWIVGSDWNNPSGYKGVIFHTTNGGNTWFEQNSGMTSPFGLWDIHFFDYNNGLTVGGTGLDVNSKSLILKTSDGGNTWSSQTRGTQEQLSRVHFVDDKNGWAVGAINYDPNGTGAADGLILHSADAGNTWVQQNNPADTQLYDVYFTDENNGWAVGSYYYSNWLDPNIPTVSKGVILHTSNGGNTWVKQRSTTEQLYGNYFIDAMNGWVVGVDYLSGSGIILHTTNGGNTWVRQNVQAVLRKVYFVDSMNGWAVSGSIADLSDHGGYYQILHTSDGGNTWTSQISGDISGLNDIYFTDINTGWAAGPNKTIFKYSP